MKTRLAHYRGRPIELKYWDPIQKEDCVLAAMTIMDGLGEKISKTLDWR